MTLNELQALLPDQDAFKRAFRKDETATLLKGQFTQGRTPFIQVFTFPDGGQVRLKFYNVVKQILNSKGQPVYGKESYLSYLEVTAVPAGQKAYCFTTDVTQIVWGTSKSKATEKHITQIDALKAYAETFGIDLSEPTAWCVVYSENY